MKTKYNSFLKIFILSLLFVSCSNDSEDTNNSETPLYIKSITEKSFYNGYEEISILNFEYLNGKLVKLVGDNRFYDIIYDGNKILKLNEFANNQLTATTFLYYNGNDLSYTINQSGDEKTSYTYENNILKTVKNKVLINGEFRDVEKNELTFDTNGNITQILKTSYYQQEVTSKIIYNHDTSNVPHKNMNPYLRLLFRGQNFDGIRSNNILTTDYYATPSSTNYVRYKYNIVLNSANYPIKIDRLTNNNELISSTTFEYQN
jgi:hypothetical protein